MHRAIRADFWLTIKLNEDPDVLAALDRVYILRIRRMSRDHPLHSHAACKSATANAKCRLLLFGPSACVAQPAYGVALSNSHS